MKHLLKTTYALGLACAIIMLGKIWAASAATTNLMLKGCIAYVSGEEQGAGTSIYVADADGSNVRRLPETDKAMFLDMDRSGQSIAFASESEELKKREIFVIGTSGTGKRQLTSNSFYDNEPRFSFDGRKIVFVSERDGASEIYIMNSDGSCQKRLTFHRSIKSAPCFSPDGKQIAFTASVAPGKNRAENQQILIINSDGTNLRRFGLSTTYTDPVWHPCGHFLLCKGNQDFAVFPLNDGKPRHLAVRGFSASWSLDGKHIVFNRVTDFVKIDGGYLASYNVFTMTDAGRDIRALVPNRRHDNTLFANRWPCWGGKTKLPTNLSGLTGH